jgi:hypothetical protein
MAQLLSLPAPFTTTYQLVETAIPGQDQKDEAGLFDGIDTSIAGLAKFAGARPPKDLTEGLGVIARAVQSAQKAFDSESDAATLKPLFDGVFATRVLRRTLKTLQMAEAAKTTSTSVCGRRRASSNRRSCSRGIRSTRWPTTASWCRDSR